jgi:hypothetical protein
MMFFAEYNALRCGKEKERRAFSPTRYCKDGKERNNWKIISQALMIRALTTLTNGGT